MTNYIIHLRSAGAGFIADVKDMDQPPPREMIINAPSLTELLELAQRGIEARERQKKEMGT